MEIKGKSVIITGGASGLGAATAHRLHGLGAKVLIADVNQEAGQTLSQQLGPGALFAETDVTEETSLEQAVAIATKEHAGVHILVTCAGIDAVGKVLGKTGPHDLAHFKQVIRINLIGTFNALRLAAAVMPENEPDPEGERGVIVSTGSVAALEGQIGQSAYAASKGGVASLTLPAARELARYGIRVVCIAPGIFDTPLLARLPEPARVSLGQQVPFPPRLGRPQEYAAMVQHVIENTMLNGATIRLDGGLRMAPR